MVIWLCHAIQSVPARQWLAIERSGAGSYAGATGAWIRLIPRLAEVDARNAWSLSGIATETAARSNEFFQIRHVLFVGVVQ